MKGWQVAALLAWVGCGEITTYPDVADGNVADPAATVRDGAAPPRRGGGSTGGTAAAPAGGATATSTGSAPSPGGAGAPSGSTAAPCPSGNGSDPCVKDEKGMGPDGDKCAKPANPCDPGNQH